MTPIRFGLCAANALFDTPALSNSLTCFLFAILVRRAITVQVAAQLVTLNNDEYIAQCSALLTIMRRWCNDSEIQTWCCAVFAAFASKGSSAHKQQLSKGNVCTLILDALKQHSEEMSGRGLVKH